jgi:hypothetical protein
MVPSLGRQVLPATHTETAPSVLWLGTIQCMERNQDLAGLTPKDCFIPAKPVERAAVQIGQTQKAMCEVGGGIKVFLPRAGPGFRSHCDTLRPLIAALRKVYSITSSARKQQRRWHIEAQRFRGFEVDDRFKLGWRLHRNFSGIGAAQNAIDIAGRASELVDPIGPVVILFSFSSPPYF